MSHPNWKTHDEFPGSISLPYGIKTSHTWHEIGKILRIINDQDIETFIELGCHVGGLASILLPLQNIRKFSYWGVERDVSITHDHVLSSGKIIAGDILTVEMKELIKSKMNGKTLIYCDGGNKIEEMRLYHDLLKSGDIIMTHDFWHGWDVVDVPGFENNAGDCKPEVWIHNLDFLYGNLNFKLVSHYLIEGTRIAGFKKI